VQYAGILEPGPDTGLVPDDPVLSPSQADTYLQCPRAYALGYRLHAADGGSVYQAFGSLIHRVLEAAESAALAAGDGHGTLEAALEALDGCWDPAAFGGGPWAEAWHHRAATLLEHLYDCWPGVGSAALLEHHLEMEVAGTRWRGRADRIEATAGSATRIVDYKTSASAVTTEQAAASVQLGFYLLAAQRDPAVTDLGPPSGAEFWYPAAPTKGVTVRRFDPEHLDEVEGRLRAAAEGIRAEDWTPQPGDHCRTCVVRRVCPARPEGREAYRG
jgi:RecB family exonuclease